MLPVRGEIVSIYGGYAYHFYVFICDEKNIFFAVKSEKKNTTSQP